ncbi:MAG: LysR family transcriptional regulator [Coriobacteriia bacterium]|nr:LysR family transcriptional regulator [Coriobacteriia bacterium]MCL2749879.1 LysR family transcriptional regulator [Coriobacteriia bacterium]
MQDFRTATFLSVCKTMNYTQSARELNITQPAVSQHIAYLEKTYDTKLFVYQKRKLTLTAAGVMLRDAFTVANHNERQLKDHIAALSDERRTLKLGVTMTAGEYILARPLAQHLAEDPTIQTRVVASDTKRLLGLLQSDSIDCALVEGFFDKSKYGWELFSTEELILVCAPEHRFAKRPARLEDLLGEHLLLRELGSGTRAVLEHELAAQNLTPGSFARVTEISSPNIIKTFVEQDYGISFLYRAAVQSELKEKRLKEVSLGSRSIKHDMTFVWLKGSLFEHENRALVNRLREIYQSHHPLPARQ